MRQRRWGTQCYRWSLSGAGRSPPNDPAAESGVVVHKAAPAGHRLSRRNLLRTGAITVLGAGERDPSVAVLGERRAHPLVVAPMAFQRMAHPDAEVAMARAHPTVG